jgi:comEA protein
LTLHQEANGCAGPVQTVVYGTPGHFRRSFMLRTLTSIALVVFTLVVATPSLIAYAPQESAARQTPKPAPGEAAVVNLNSATAVELEKLPGVGPATATRIVEYRQKNGAFKKIEDLMNVRGIGEKTFLNLKPLITVAPPKGLAV